MPRRRSGAPPPAPVNEGAVPRPARIFHGHISYGWNRSLYTDANDDFTNTLRTQGFALLKLQNPYIKQMKIAGERRFALQPATKLGLARTADEGFVRCAHKELFHYGPGSDALGSNRHVRTAPCAFRDDAMVVGSGVLKLINATELSQHGGVAKPDEEAVDAWYGSRGQGCDVDASVITDFLYLPSNPALMHSNAHVDKGLLTLCYNPVAVELCVDGEWIIPFGGDGDGDSVLLVMVGYTLERASAGVFRAALHRVRNRGRRRALVAKIRAPPHLAIHPRVITRRVVSCLIVGSTEPFTVGDLQSQFEEVHGSVNAPAPAGHLSGAILQIEQPTQGVLSLMPELLLMIVGQLSARQLASLRRVSRFLRELASLEQLWVPLAERAHVDWNLALDRVDKASPSVGRSMGDGTPIPAAQLLEQFGQQLHALVCAEAFDDEMFSESWVTARVITQDGNEIHFRIKMGAPLQKLMHAFCNRKGVSMNSVRFLFDGNRINETHTPTSLEFENDEIIDVMVEQQGD